MKTKLEKIRIILGLQEQKFEDVTLSDGTILTTESLEPGYPIFVMNEDGTQSPVAEGTYETGTQTIVVDALGIIVSVEDNVAPVAPETPVEPAEMAEPEEVSVETPAEVEPSTSAFTPEQLAELKSMIDAAVQEILSALGMSKQIETAMASIEALNNRVEKFANTPAAPKIPKFTPVSQPDPMEAKLEAIQNMKNASKPLKN